MKHRQSQTGSAHVIVIVLLVVALLGTLGFVFYQNFIAKKEDNSTKQVVTQTNTDASATTTTQVAFNSSIYELDYPKNGWSVSTEKLNGSIYGSSKTKLINQAKNVQVEFTVTEGGLGGSCDVNDGLKLSYYKVYDTPVKKLTDEPLYLVESMVDATGGGYYYTIGLTPDDGKTHATVGDSRCTVSLLGVASTVLFENTANGQVLKRPTIIATITFPKLATDKPISEMQPVKDMLATDDYKAAVKIIESARKN